MIQPDDSGSTFFSIGSWVFSTEHGETVRILDVEFIWDNVVRQVWIPGKRTVERLAAGSFAVHELGLTLEDVRKWTPPEKQRKTPAARKKKAQ